MICKTFHQLSKERLKTILNLYPNVRIAVIGDFCLDVYWILDMSMSEPSLETRKMTRPVKEQRYSLGGAGNVAANLYELGVVEIHVFGIVGDDPFGHKMLSLLKEKSNCDHLLVSNAKSWQTLAYCKPYIGNEECQRLDMGQFNRLPDTISEELVGRLAAGVSSFDIIIINQQMTSGIHTAFLREQLGNLITQKKGRVFIYDGRQVQDTYRDVWLKLNAHEALRLCGKEKDTTDVVPTDEVIKAIEIIFKRMGRSVVVTLGEQGCVICTDDGIMKIPGIQVMKQIDPVGAGDSFLAGLSASLACGASLEEAAQIGNYVASVTITKMGQTGTATPGEIMEVGASPLYNEEL